MEILRGIAVAPGIALGPAVVLEAEEYRIPSRNVEPAAHGVEFERVREAIRASIEELEQQALWLKAQLGHDAANVFTWHIGVLRDAKLASAVERYIREQNYSAAYATSTVMRGYQRRFLQMSDPLLVDRIRDVRDIERRLLRNILGESREDWAHLTQAAILVAHDLTPTQTAQLAGSMIEGVILDMGGATSHTAILLHSWGKPAVIGVGDVSTRVGGGDTVIVDALNQLVIHEPDEATLAEYRERRSRQVQLKAELAALRDQPAVTQDGVEITLLANIGFAHEAAQAIEAGAVGIGLFRTEFLFFQPKGSPDEEEQYGVYRAALEAAGGRPVTIRTFDLGADKYTQQKRYEQERNPMLGLRSIRYSLANLPLFKAQLRAILRASVHGPVRLMFPLIVSLIELRQARLTLRDAMEDLDELGQPYNRGLPVGIMVETPAAALRIEDFCREVDFISLGTNDLLQYLLAVDRSNEEVSRFYNPSHPALLRTLARVVAACERAGVECGICGEMAGQPLYTLFLLGIGLRSLSMAPTNLAEIKKLVRLSTLGHAVEVANKALTFETEREVANFLRKESRRFLSIEEF